MGARWTEEEDALVRDYYTLKGGVKKLMKLMPHRTRAAIVARSQILGCKRWSFKRVAPGLERKRATKFLYINYQRAAEKRGYSFEIDRKEFATLIRQPCHYCGDTGSNRHTVLDKDLIYNGIDRVDNERGYVAGNVVPCCGNCNRAKSVMGQDDFLAWISRVYHHSILRGKTRQTGTSAWQPAPLFGD